MTVWIYGSYQGKQLAFVMNSAAIVKTNDVYIYDTIHVEWSFPMSKS